MSLREKIRILVVDDMSTSRSVITQSLYTLGIRHVFTADDGEDGLNSAMNQPVHLVISDYNMPNMDGLKLLYNLRSMEKTKNIGFILVTGRAEQQIIDYGRRLGMNNYLKKPFDTTQLRSCLEKVVGPI